MQIPPTDHPGAGVLDDLLNLPDANPRDLRGDNSHTAQLKSLLEDRDVGLYLFAQVVFGFHDLRPDIHLPICQAIGRWGESVLDDGTIITKPPGEHDTVVDSWRRLMVRIPRECQHPDDLAQTPDGPVPIGTLEPGDWLAALDDDLDLVWNKVLRTHASQARMLLIKTRSGSQIRVTPNHPVRTVRGWLPASDLCLGDGFCAPTTVPFLQRNYYQPYFAGVLCGDGCLPTTSGRRQTPTLTSEDPEILDSLESDGIKYRKRRKFSNKAQVYSFHKEDWQHLPESLWCGAWDKKIPVEYEGSADFLSGLFDTDGCVSKHRCVFTTVSAQLATDVVRNLRYFGVVARKQRYNSQGPNGYRGTAWHVTVGGHHYCKAFHDNVGFRLPHKREALQRLLGSHEGKRTSSRINAVPSGWRGLLKHRPKGSKGPDRGDTRILSDNGIRVDNHYWTSRDKVTQAAQILDRSDIALLAKDTVFWDEIVGIEDIGTQPIVELEVGGNHTYISEGLLSHNCFKTSLCTRAGATWTILRSAGYSARLGIFNEKLDNAKSWVGAVAAVVEGSHLLHVLWPDALPKGIPFWDREKGVTKSRSLKWGESGVLFNNDSPGVSELSIEPHGIGGAATGKHFTHKILDDIIGLKASRSLPEMQEAIDWVDTARALERPAENGCELVPHTTWAYHDVYCWAPESRVWMADGSHRPISRLAPGDKVIGFRKVPRLTKPELLGKQGGARSATELCVTEVVACGQRPGALVSHLLDDGSSFRCTEEHKFFKVWKSGRGERSYETVSLTDHDYSEVKNLTRLRKVMNPFDPCPDHYTAGWLGGMYDADGSYGRNCISIYQSEKCYPEVCDRIRESLSLLGIVYREYDTTQENTISGIRRINEMKKFVISTREGRAKFLAWCRPTKHADKIAESLLGARPFHVHRITGRSQPELGQVYWIETGTGNYICEGLASKNSHMQEKWPGEYKLYHRALLENESGEPDIVNGKSIFPEKISTAQARRMHKADPFVFSAQYMCMPKAGRHQDFNEDHLRFGQVLWRADNPYFQIDRAHYSPAIYNLGAEWDEGMVDTPPPIVPLHWLNKAIILDPAPTKEPEQRRDPNARNGIVVAGQDPWGRFYCLQALGLAESPTEILNQLVLLAHRWRTRRVAIEEVNFSYVYRPLYYEILRQRGEVKLEFVPTKPEGRDKTERILDNLQPHFGNGYWYFNRGPDGTAIGPCAELVQEILEFPFGRTRDIVDALSYTREVTTRPLTPTEDERSFYLSSRRGRSRGSTGYNDYMGETSSHA